MVMKTPKDRLIKNVKEAIQVCYTAPQNEDQGYPYAAGYARSCLQTVLDYLLEEQEAGQPAVH
jgi:hypothetical protein